MGTVHIRARLAPGYGALERVLRDCERQGFDLEQLHVSRTDDDAMELDVRLANVPAHLVALLSSRFERHFGVFSGVAVRQGDAVREREVHELAL